MNQIRRKLIAHGIIAFSIITISSLAVATGATLIHTTIEQPSYVVLAQQHIEYTRAQQAGDRNRDIQFTRAAK